MLSDRSRSMSLSVTIPMTWMGSLCCGERLLLKLAVDCASKQRSPATRQRIDATSTGGSVYIMILLRPSTYLYKVRADGPNIRSKCGRCRVGLVSPGLEYGYAMIRFSIMTASRMRSPHRAPRSTPSSRRPHRGRSAAIFALQRIRVRTPSRPPSGAERLNLPLRRARRSCL